MKVCIACGMPMSKKEDFAMADESKDYCLHCAREDGSMQSFEEKRKGTIRFIMKTQGLDQEVAEKTADSIMAKLPAWKEQYA